MKNKKKFENIIFIICCIVFVYSSYKLISYYITMNEVKKEFDEIENAVFIDSVTINSNKIDDIDDNELIKEDKKFNYAELEKINKDCIGWIDIENTNISYPVMYKKNDNNFYLRRNIEKKYSIAGIPFLDGNCDIGNNKFYIIYGHNMKDNSMFSELEKYKDIDFFDKNNQIILYIGNQKNIYQVFAAGVINSYVDYKLYDINRLKTDDEYNKYINEIKNKIYFNKNLLPIANEPILLLSTCDYTQKNGRMIVLAKLVFRYDDEY